jgi:hypothetical protein
MKRVLGDGRGSEEKNYQPLLGFEPPIIQPVVQRYTTELSSYYVKLVHTFYLHLLIVIK